MRAGGAPRCPSAGCPPPGARRPHAPRAGGLGPGDRGPGRESRLPRPTRGAGRAGWGLRGPHPRGPRARPRAPGAPPRLPCSAGLPWWRRTVLAPPPPRQSGRRAQAPPPGRVTLGGGAGPSGPRRPRPARRRGDGATGDPAHGTWPAAPAGRGAVARRARGRGGPRGRLGWDVGRVWVPFVSRMGEDGAPPRWDPEHKVRKPPGHAWPKLRRRHLARCWAPGPDTA